MSTPDSVVKLAYPIILRGTEIDSVTVRRIKVRDLVFAEQNGGENEDLYGAALAASVTGLSMEEFGEIDSEDAARIGVALKAVMGNAKSADGDGQPS